MAQSFYVCSVHKTPLEFELIDGEIAVNPCKHCLDEAYKVGKEVGEDTNDNGRG